MKTEILGPVNGFASGDILKLTRDYAYFSEFGAHYFKKNEIVTLLEARRERHGGKRNGGIVAIFRVISKMGECELCFTDPESSILDIEKI